jgi:predicted methyltransferase
LVLFWAKMLIISHYQAEPLLLARKAGKRTEATSPDLGLTEVEVRLEDAGVLFPDGEHVSWAALEKIARSDTKCFVVEEGSIWDVRFFSEETNWLRSLMPTRGAPTMLVSGISMHRIKGVDPYKDTLLKIKTIAPIVGRVLDTATGLGYTAIEAAKSAEQVVTIELDPAALEVARYNPWSKALFDNPKIEQIVGDTYDEIDRFEANSFSRIIHDPPAFGLGGELYSSTFYKQLYRVLKHGGRLFHYIGDLESKSGRVTTKGVVRRLEEAGFVRIHRRPEAFGLVAYK